jgi:hypothetical protein
MAMDPKKFQDKLAEAINRGFVKVSVDPDGIMRYTWTHAGLRQVRMEQLQKHGYNTDGTI